MRTIHIGAEKKKLLTSYNLAHKGWKTVLDLLLEIKQRNLQPSTGAFEGLMVAVTVLYGRPFKSASGLTKLKEFASFDEYPNKAQLGILHKTALDARDWILAHQDVSRWPDLQQTSSDSKAIDKTYVTILDDGILGVEAGMLLPPGKLHLLMPDLLTVQIRRVEDQRIKLITACLPPNIVPPERFCFDT